MAERNRLHILVQARAQAEAYRPPPRRISGPKLPVPEDPLAHGHRLRQGLVAAEEQGRVRREQHDIEVQGAVDGIYVSFESFPDVHLALESLDPRRGKLHPELVAVREIESGDQIVEEATVFVPDGKLGYFLRQLDRYIRTAGEERQRHRNLYDRIAAIGLASLEQLWTDPPDELPVPEEVAWWEVWLRRRDGDEHHRFAAFAERAGIRVGQSVLGFADRTVVLVEATATQLAVALDVLDDLAELRRPQESAALLTFEAAAEQADWVATLAERTEPASADAPAVCVVDTGVYRLHPLLEMSLHTSDCHACDPRWGVGDHHGHGTEMAGLALFGDVGSALLSSGRVRLRHRLESVKLLPPRPSYNPKELYGAVTAAAASRVEVARPKRRRVFSMAITSDRLAETDTGEPRAVYGQPSSWSSALDALSAGLAIDTAAEGLVYLDEAELAAHRLFIVSAGNIDVGDADHLARSDVEPVNDPGQAWNALTVGAFTDLDDMSQASDFSGWMPVAPRGELSPFSRTSVAFGRSWPVKPDVVLEGGNAAQSPSGRDFDTPEVLQLLTTKAPLRDQRLLTVTRATSAATAQAGHLGASILADYPSLWPETVRALIVHSAQWTEAMHQRFGGAATRRKRVALHRRYGMGVPDLVRATRSADDSLTLVIEDVIHPFDGQGRMREMHLHNLPWPAEVLADLGGTVVQMRVTLSYYIEPNPGRRGWARRYSYASHGLRFEVRRATESTDNFRKRVNALARAEDERHPTSDSDSSEWFFGSQARTAGSLHTDLWTGTAADLAQRGVLAIYPVNGWWKQRKDRDHSMRGARYSLIVSIDTPEVDVDIYTPVAQQVGIPIEVGT